MATAHVRADHDVLWACSSDLRPAIEQWGIPTVAAGFTTAERHQRVGERAPELANLSPDERAFALAPLLFGEILAPKMLTDLETILQEWRPQIVIHDSMEFAAPIVAASLGISNVAHSFGPLTPEYRIAAITDRVSSLWKSAGLECRPYAGLYDHLYLDIYPPSMQPMSGDHVTRRALLRPVPLPAKESAFRTDFMGGDPDDPLVYVTYGTEVKDDKPLRQLIDALASLPLRLVVTVGDHRVPDAFGPQPHNVVIRSFTPQMAVLPHASAVVSHGGSGTVLAALALGIPQLCLPYFADQPLNAVAVAAAGAGLYLDPASADNLAIAGAVTRLVAENRFRQQACRIADEIRAMPEPDEVAALVAQLG
jgi:UDP:flavonoid glycosyltransferase YjiC (YdhE family)